VKAAVFSFVSWSVCMSAVFAEEPAGANASAPTDQSGEAEKPKPAPRWKIELKRQVTDHGTEGETTDSKVRLEAYPDGAVAMLRLDLPFPDADTDFEGDPYHPRLGDIKVRAKARAFHAGGLPLSPYIELTFPTANPKTLGQGKYQVMAGVETSFNIASFNIGSSTHRLSFAPLVEQTVSVAGDSDFKNINYTKLELALRDAWRNYGIKLTLKPVIDWEQDGLTGAVMELEGRVSFRAGWAVQLMLGHRVWGGSVPSTYGTRVELTLGRTF
jgi:hypothetical protein